MKNRKFCAHRGLSALMPENTLPAFGAAIALGADEIEFDVWLTRDGRMIVSHDETLERISDGMGNLADLTLKEITEMNAGHILGWHVPFCTPEEIFEQFANRTVFNIHLKEAGEQGSLVRELVKLAQKHNACDSIYFAASPAELEWIQRAAPDIPRVAIQLPEDEIGIYEMAKTFDCSGVQFWLDMFDEELINRLHADNIWCNLYFADGMKAYEKYFGMGIDTLLTNRMDLAADYRRTMMNK